MKRGENNLDKKNREKEKQIFSAFVSLHENVRRKEKINNIISFSPKINWKNQLSKTLH